MQAQCCLQKCYLQVRHREHRRRHTVVGDIHSRKRRVVPARMEFLGHFRLCGNTAVIQHSSKIKTGFCPEPKKQELLSTVPDVSEGVLALSPERDGCLDNMLLHTTCEKCVAAPPMLPVCTNLTDNALDDCMLDEDDDDDSVGADGDSGSSNGSGSGGADPGSDVDIG